MEKPLVSVVVPVFNRAGLIGHTIESIRAQSLRNIEIIVVDDASTDNTGAVVQQISDPRIQYIRLEQNSGPSGARNAGVAQANGEFVAFLDSDDEWNTQKLELQVAAIRQQAARHNVVCYTQVIVVQDDRTYTLPTRDKMDGESVGEYVMCGSHGLIHTSSIMLARELAVANPFPLDQYIFEDWDLFLRLEDQGAKWLYVDRPLTTWNNESRHDRLTLSEHDGSVWLEQHRRYLSEKARKAFVIKGIVRPLMRSRQRKVYAFKMLCYAFPGGDLPVSEFLKLSLKIFIPPALLGWMKARSSFGTPNSRSDSQV